MLTWKGESDAGRRIALSGSVEVGAVFPQPWDEPSPWHWRLFVGPSLGSTARARVGMEGKAKSELAAKGELDAAWVRFLAAAGLTDWAA
jgi:hypothetical protein